jgi:hypothetical protein
MATKKITPKDPQADATKAETDKAAERKTQVAHRGGRKVARKTGARYN